MQPDDNTKDQDHPEITLLSLSVQQLTDEARSLRETLQQERSSRDSKVMLILLGIIAVAAIAVMINLLF